MTLPEILVWLLIAGGIYLIYRLAKKHKKDSDEENMW